MDYARAAVEHFVRLRGKGTAVSAADEALLLSWEADGIPLEIVLEGVDTAFERKREAPKSLSECGRWVRAAFKKRAADDGTGTPSTERARPMVKSELNGLPADTRDSLERWRKSSHAALREAAEEMWTELLAEVATVGVVPRELAEIVDEAVRLGALERGASDEDVDAWMRLG